MSCAELVLKILKLGTFICSTLQHKCLVKGTMAITCNVIKTALGVTTYERGVSAENATLTNLNANDCCQPTTNEKLVYFPTNSWKL